MATWGRDWLEYDASNTVQRSQAEGSRELQPHGHDFVDYHQSPADGGRTWLEDGGRTLQRVLTAALAGILSLLLAWRILLGLDERDVDPKTVDDVARTTTAGGGNVAGSGARVCGQIDWLNVGGTEPVTHDNATATAAASGDLASQVGEAIALGDSLPGNLTQFSEKRAPAGSVSDSPVDLPSRNCAAAVGEGSGGVCHKPHVALTEDGPDVALASATHNFARPTSNSQAMFDDFTGMSCAEAGHGEDVPSFRRRPLMCSDG